MKNQSTGQVKSLVCDQNVQWNYQDSDSLQLQKYMSNILTMGQPSVYQLVRLQSNKTLKYNDEA